MFKRRTPLSTSRKIRETVWPSMGPRRAGLYYFYRLVRLSDTTHQISAGLANGVAVSFSPIMGTHFIQSLILCLVMRANIFAAFIGTAAGNPWTLPFIWWVSYQTGKFVAGIFGWQAKPLPDHEIGLAALREMLFHQPMDLIVPWMIGGYLIAVIIWFPSYYLFYGLITAMRTAREKLKDHQAAT